MRGILRKISLAVAAIILFLCNGRVENTCFMANRNAGAAYRLENGISNENMDVRCILASYKRRKVE